MSKENDNFDLEFCGVQVTEAEMQAIEEIGIPPTLTKISICAMKAGMGKTEFMQSLSPEARTVLLTKDRATFLAQYPQTNVNTSVRAISDGESLSDGNKDGE